MKLMAIVKGYLMGRQPVNQDKIPEDQTCIDCSITKARGGIFRAYSAMTQKHGEVWYVSSRCNKCHYKREVELCPIKRAKRDRAINKKLNRIATKKKIAEYFKEKDYE